MSLRRNIRRPLLPLSTTYPKKPISALTYKKKKNKPFLFSHELRQYHMQVLGTPGGGKTKFLEACIREDIKKKNGVLLFDPSGNLYNDLVKWSVQHGWLDRRPFILLNANDPTHTFAFNPLELEEILGESPRGRRMRIEHVVDAVMLAIGAIQGGEDPESMPEYNRIMRLILQTLAHHGMTLCEASVFTDYESLGKATRGELCANLPDAAAVRSWAEINSKKRDEFDLLMRAPRNRFDRFNSPTLSCIVGQHKSSFDFRSAMDDGAVILVNLGSSGYGLTRTESTILGRLLFNNLTLKTEQRLRVNGRVPRPLNCVIDEADRYLNNDVANAIDKLRQNGLHMVISHQNIGQLDNAGVKVRGAVLGSTATKVFFSLTAEDAAHVARQVYAARIQLDKTLDTLDKPTVVAYNRELMNSAGHAISRGEGEAAAYGKGSSNTTSAGLALRDGTSFFGPGEVEIMHSEGSSSGQSFMESVAKSSFYSETISKSMSEALVPELAWLPTSRYSLDEQLMEREYTLTHLSQGECVVSLPHAISFDARVPWLTESVVTDERLQKVHDIYHKQRPEMYTNKDDVFNTLNIDSYYKDTSTNEEDADNDDLTLSQPSWD